ncbi:MAG: NUDIX domain-containing protein [Acidobacteriota bacterium]|nr:NUDIX domain-containing protein [Acidobacteriota bacterium]
MLKKIVGTIWKNLTPYLRLKIIRATQQKFTVSVAAVIINENEEVLLLDHVLRPFLSWGIPGGFVKRGEQPEEAVMREIREETGLELQNLKLFRVRTINRHIEILFRAEATGKAEVKSCEINAAAWFETDKMPEQMNAEQKSVVKQILQIK